VSGLFLDRWSGAGKCGKLVLGGVFGGPVVIVLLCLFGVACGIS